MHADLVALNGLSIPMNPGSISNQFFAVDQNNLNLQSQDLVANPGSRQGNQGVSLSNSGVLPYFPKDGLNLDNRQNRGSPEAPLAKCDPNKKCSIDNPLCGNDEDDDPRDCPNNNQEDSVNQMNLLNGNKKEEEKEKASKYSMSSQSLNSANSRLIKEKALKAEPDRAEERAPGQDNKFELSGEKKNESQIG